VTFIIIISRVRERWRRAPLVVASPYFSGRIPRLPYDCTICMSVQLPVVFQLWSCSRDSAVYCFGWLRQRQRFLRPADQEPCVTCGPLCIACATSTPCVRFRSDRATRRSPHEAALYFGWIWASLPPKCLYVWLMAICSYETPLFRGYLLQGN